MNERAGESCHRLWIDNVIAAAFLLLVANNTATYRPYVPVLTNYSYAIAKELSCTDEHKVALPHLLLLLLFVAVSILSKGLNYLSLIDYIATHFLSNYKIDKIR
jgi:hypothetical protein